MGLLTLLPPLAAIMVAVATRRVIVALLVGLGLSELLIAGGVPGGTLDLSGYAATDAAMETGQRIIAAAMGNAQVLIFCLLIGVLIVFMRESGGVAAMARALIRSGVAKSPRRAELAVAATGTGIFIETNVSLLSAGVLGRPLYDAHGLSRERLAYVIDSTSSPISVLLLFNAWGAYALGLVTAQGVEEPLAVVMGSIGWNFYAILTILGVYFSALSGKAFGPMARADAAKAPDDGDTTVPPTRAIYMGLPLLVMVGGALALMVWTGEGDIRRGDGALSILVAIIAATVLAGALLFRDKVFGAAEMGRKASEGLWEMAPLVLVLLLSLALGGSVRELGTGTYVSQIAAGALPPFAAAAALFVTAAVTSFTTGTSWGTYGILVPIAMPLAQALGIPPSMALAAVLGGGVFGDHASPISDTTLIASVAAGTTMLDHVKTQLPYALTAAALASAFYLVAGVMAG